MANIVKLLDDAYLRVEILDMAEDAESLLGRGHAFRRLIESAREEAGGALEDLIHKGFGNLDEVRELQWKVTRYDDLCRWIKAMIEEGTNAREDISEDERVELRRMVQGETEQQEDYPE